MPGGRHENMRPWTSAEDAIIHENVEVMGNKWADIVKQLDDRTVSSVRNRWQRIQKGRERANEKGNRCHKCGQLKRGHTCTEEDPEVDLPLANVRVKFPRLSCATPPKTEWGAGTSSLLGMDIPMTAMSVMEEEAPQTPPPKTIVEAGGADGADEVNATEASTSGERGLRTTHPVTVASVAAKPDLERMDFSDAMPPPDLSSFPSLDEPSAPEPPPPLVSRSYSTASSILANLAEPGTVEFQPRTMSASNILVNSRAAVVDSMASLIKGFEKNGGHDDSSVNDENELATGWLLEYAEAGPSDPPARPPVQATLVSSLPFLPLVSAK